MTTTHTTAEADEAAAEAATVTDELIETVTDPPTITEPTDTDTAAAAVAGELVSFPVDVLVPHPDNPRSSLGDLDELARSIKSHGVLQPVVVLPVGEDGRHLIVAGHRRHAAAVKAKVSHVPGIIRDLTPVEVLETMLVENVNRSDLTTSEEVRAIERLMDLAEGKLTPARLCKRIGRSQGWVRTRMAICALSAPWREAIDEGKLSLASGEAAASVADLGPEHVEALCQEFTRHHWGDHARQADAYRQRIEREAAYAAAVDKARRRKGAAVLTVDDGGAVDTVAVEHLLEGDEAKEHRKLPCHAVLIERTSYGQGFQRTDVCTDPDTHLLVEPDEDDNEDGTVPDPGGDRGRGGNGSPAQPRRPEPPSGPDLHSSHLKRKGRLARTAFTKELFARSRGGFSQAQATRMAFQAFIEDASHDALEFAAEVLGHENRSYGIAQRLLAMADTPAALCRLAGAVAMGTAETRMYNGYSGTTCRDYMTALTSAGWEPDTWTAAIIDQLTARDKATKAAEAAEAAAAERGGSDEAEGDGSDQGGAEAGAEGDGVDISGDPAMAAEVEPGGEADQPDDLAKGGDGAEPTDASDEPDLAGEVEPGPVVGEPPVGEPGQDAA